MLPLGFLFGMGFDTATEVALLGIAASERAKDLPIWSMLVFPAFAAGMSLVDSTEGVLMLGAYEWAFVRHVRKLYHNLVITLRFGGGGGDRRHRASGLEAARLGFDGRFWGGAQVAAAHLNELGLIVIAMLIAIWRYRRLDEIELDHSAG